MKQFVVLLMLSSYGMYASLYLSPYAGVAIYYLYAVLRPQFLWKWQMYNAPVSLPWSAMVGGAAIVGYLAWASGLLSYGRRDLSLMRFRAQFTIAHWLMMAFAFWVFLSYVFSNNQSTSENWFGEHIKIFVMYFLASRVVRTPRQLTGLYLLILLALFYVSWEMNMIYIQTGRPTIARDGFAGLDNNGAGLMLALAVPLCYFAWEFTIGYHRWLYLLMIPVILHAVGMSYSRGAMASILLSVPFYFIYSRKRRTLAFFAVCAMFALPFMFGKEIQNRFFSIDKRDTDDSWQVRQLAWKIGMDIANDYPLFGAGIRCSNSEMARRGADMEGRTIHMQYLQIAADSGYPALALYIAMALATFYCIWRARFALWSRQDYEAKRACAMLGGIECSLISFLIGASFLSLEVFEVSYLLFFMGAQVWGLMKSTDNANAHIQPGVWMQRPLVASARVPMPMPGGHAHGLPQYTPRGS
ncbi:MAG: O-antigen ligase family protein [Gemmataceae bacterium]